MAGRSGRYTECRSYRSRAFYGWTRQPPSGMEGPTAGERGFHSVKAEPHFVLRRMGTYGRAWLRWLDREGSTSAIFLAQFCPQGSASLRWQPP